MIMTRRHRNDGILDWWNNGKSITILDLPSFHSSNIPVFP
jgi:hypothetical protein